MRDNQPKMSEAAAASLRSGELETGRGWRMLNSGRMVTSFLALTIMFQFLLVSAPCALCCANLGPPAAWRRAVAEIFIFHFSLSCSPGRRAADGDTAASRGEVTRTNSNIISLRPVSGQCPRRTPGWRRGHRQGPDHRSLGVDAQRGLLHGLLCPPPPPRRGRCVPSLSPAAWVLAVRRWRHRRLARQLTPRRVRPLRPGPRHTAPQYYRE